MVSNDDISNLTSLETIDDGEVLKHLAATSEGDKIKALLPSSLRKAMEQKAKEYTVRPHIRSYSRTIYNMAEIGLILLCLGITRAEKWINPQNPRNNYALSHLLGQGYAVN